MTPTQRSTPAAFNLAALWIVLLVTLAACGTTVPRTAHRSPPPAPLLLVSLDGFRPADLDRGITPHLGRLAASGVRARWMTPAYPALTFPNHYTLVTGLRPDRHGIVHNTIRDPALGVFRMSDRQAVGDARWWGGEPLWVTAEKAGLPTATLSWPGSEAAIRGQRPRRWLPFDKERPIADRVDTVLAWMAEPQATRPRLATLYFEHVDEASHAHGPDSPEAAAAIAAVDAAIGRLVDGLARAVPGGVNLVLVSDHGMATVPAGQAVAVEDMADPADVIVVSTGQVVGFELVPGRQAQALARLLGRHAHHACWRRADLPPRWQHGSHPRVADVVCQMDEGWDAVRGTTLARRRAGGERGSHGYDPQLPSMRALFIGHGPAFRSGVVLPGFDNVDVYPLLARLLGVPAVAHDGDAGTLLPALRDAPATQAR